MVQSISAILSVLTQLRSERDQLKQSISGIDEKIRAVQITLDLLMASSDTTVESVSSNEKAGGFNA